MMTRDSARVRLLKVLTLDQVRSITSRWNATRQECNAILLATWDRHEPDIAAKIDTIVARARR